MRFFVLVFNYDKYSTTNIVISNLSTFFFVL